MMAATQEEKKAIREMQEEIGRMKTDLAVIKLTLDYTKNKVQETADFIEVNKRGITTAALLDSKLTATILTALVGAVIFFIVKTGGVN